MKSKYTINHEKDWKAKSSAKVDKLEWWWAILLIFSIIVCIALVIIGFYDLPGTSGFGTTIESISRNQRKASSAGCMTEPLTTQSLINNVLKISSKRTENLHIELNVLVTNFNKSRISSNEKLPLEKKHLVTVKITPKYRKTNKSIVLRTYYEDNEDVISTRNKNRISNTFLNTLHVLVESRKVLLHEIVFLVSSEFDSEENEVFEQQLSSLNVGTFIDIGSLQGEFETVILTGFNGRWLLDSYFKSTKGSHFCLVCDEITKSNYLRPPQETKTETFQRLNLLYTYRRESPASFFASELIEKQTQSALDWNILSLIRNIDNSEKFDAEYDSRDVSQSIFYNFFDIFLIIYSETDGLIINIIVSVVAFATIAFSMYLMQQWAVTSASEIWIQFGIAFGIQVGTLVLGGGLVILIAFLYDYIRHLITWVPRFWLVFGIYFCPFIFTMCIFPIVYLGWRRFRSIPLRFGIMLFLHSNCFIFTIGILTLTGLSIRTAFVIVSGIAFYTVSLLIVLVFQLYKRPFAWIFPIVVGQILPIAFFTYLAMMFYSVYIPVASMPNSSKKIEFLLAFAAVGFSMLMFGFVIPLFVIFRKSKTLLSAFMIVMIVFLIMTFTNMFTE